MKGFTHDEIGYNTILLIQAGLVEEWGAGARNMNNQYECYGSNLTWKGHEFLDNARNENVWKEGVEKIGANLVTVSFAVLQDHLTDIVNGLL